MTRREFIKTSAGTSLTTASCLFGQPPSYGGFRMGLHSFVLRQIPFDNASDVVHALGLHYLETFESHLSQYSPPERLAEVKRKLQERGIKLAAYGVVGFDGGAEERTITTFKFAKEMGIETISANPAPETFDLIEKLVEETGINVAIHPHGPEYDRYPGWKSVRKAISGRHQRIGLCLDIEHISRTGESAIEAIYELGPRVYDVHLKDVDRLGPKGHGVIVGTGVVDIPGVFRALKAAGYRGIISLECELDESHPVPDILQSLKYLRQILNQGQSGGHR